MMAEVVQGRCPCLRTSEAPRGRAAIAICGRTRRRPCSAKGPRTRRSCSSASSRATTRISRVAPFVGPAGKLLDRALEDAGIDRRKVYVTNVVKHFKWEPRGKRRIHKKPRQSEIAACRPWLDDELAIVKPKVLVCLGSTAAQALLGRAFRVTAQRGTPVPSPLAPLVMATVHPSSILRAPDDTARRLEMTRFTDDLRAVARALSSKR